jgi:peptide chain release factor 2
VRDFTDDLSGLARRLSDAEKYLNLDVARLRVPQLEAEASRPDLWDDPEAARRVTSEMARLRADVDLFDALEARLSDAAVLFELAREEGDESQVPELEETVASVSAALDELELRSLFTGEHDELDAVCDIRAGEGGTDAQDWAEMMLRMYLRWAERRGFDAEVEEVSEGKEAGILSTTFIVRGRYAYGLLCAERGTHRLVRISPFDAAARRQTSFAAVDVTPFLEDVGDVQIDEKDLRIDTYRSSGAGGQHVNVTDSAVRITHLPSGIVVAVQNERSQHQNKAKAMQILGAKLAERQVEERQAELQAISGPSSSASMGAQIRSYVLAPYQMVKDLRTEHEVGNVDAVLDGDIEEFMEAWLRWRRAADGA